MFLKVFILFILFVLSVSFSISGDVEAARLYFVGAAIVAAMTGGT